MSMIFLIRPNVRRKRRLFGTRDTTDGIVLICLFTSPAYARDALLQLDRTARLLELLLHVLGLGLRHAFLHRLGSAVDEILRLLEAQAGQLPHHLDDLDLLVAGAGEDDGEVLLLGCRRGGTAARGRRGRDRHRGRRRHAELVLELLHERRGVYEAHALEIVLHLLTGHFHSSTTPFRYNRRCSSRLGRYACVPPDADSAR